MRLAIVSRDGMKKIAEDYLQGLTIEKALHTAACKSGYKDSENRYNAFPKYIRHIPRFATYVCPTKNKKNKKVEILGPCPEVTEELIFPEEINAKKVVESYKKRKEYTQMQLSVLNSGIFTIEKALWSHTGSTRSCIRDSVYGFDNRSNWLSPVLKEMIPGFLKYIKEFGLTTDSAVITYGSEACRDKIIKTLDNMALEKIVE